MADLNANINVGIETTQALNQLKALQRQISQFHQSVAKSSAQAGIAQRDLQRNFLNGVNAIQGFSAELKTVRTTAETFTNSLEKNKFSLRQYFRYAAGASKTFGKNFSAEMSTIEKTAIERVKTLQTQYVKMGRDASGAMQAIAIRPTVLNMKDLGTQTAIAAQKQVLFNQLIKQGSTNLLNFGKNTQWAGRQLMVGFTLPLATLGITAGRVFMDMEKAAIKFKKVYGDLFTAPGETEEAMESIIELGKAYTAYGVSVADSLSMAADAAAAGFAGIDLQNQTAAALKLSVLGQLELQKALETTISLQNAFGISSAELATEIDFLNAVENQTVISLDDMTTAIPKVAPVIKSLGGDVRDLAFFMAAMKEGGINASEGANALKSGLASLINPTERAREMLSGFGVNLRGIINANQGDVTGVVVDFANALDELDPLNRAQAIEQLFGKFQFARLSTLFANVAKDGTQAARVLELAGSSVEELAALSEGELGVSAASAMNKFLSAVENIKLALAPIGKTFLEIATPIIEFGTKMLEAFNNLPDGIKKSIATVITVIGGIGPIALMTFGLINNGIANMIKFFATVRLGYLKITGQAQGVGDETSYMTQEQLEAAAAAASLDQAHAGLTQRFTAEKTAVDQLRIAYQQAADAGARFALLNPGMMKSGGATQAEGFARGGIISGPGSGTSDSIPALLSNGEAVIPAEQVKKYAPVIEALIAGKLPGFSKGVMLGMPKSIKSVSKSREVGDEIYQDLLKSSYANVPPTEYGHQISKTSGHSFPIFGLGGVYSKPGGEKVFVKPVLDEAAALAEIRATQIARQAHGLEAPEQKIVVIRDPLDPTRERRFLALESALDTKFIQNEPKAIFNEEQYFRQLVASLLRVDKDLSASNVFGNVVADVGPAGVFDRASGKRGLKTDLPSMEDQALINLLGIKGGAKKAFAESTLGLMSGMTAEQYHQRMIAEIQRVLPALKQTIAGFGLTNPKEVQAYDAMIKRLETGLGVDWSKFHAIHSKVVPTVPKKAKVTQAVNLANGGMVRGPGGPKDDAIPANLSNGEAVIDAETVKKNPGIIAALFQKKKIRIPGYSENNGRHLSVSPESGDDGGSFREISVYGNDVSLHSKTANQDLNKGTLAREKGQAGGADPAMLRQELIDAKGKILAPIIYEIASNLGATTPAEVQALLQDRPELIQLAKDVSDGMAGELENLVDGLSDPEYAEIFRRQLREKVAALDEDIQQAAEEVITEITTIEDNTVQRIRSKGGVEAQGRIKAFQDKQTYRANEQNYKNLASNMFDEGTLPSQPVLTHLGKRPKVRSQAEFDETFAADLAPEAQRMKDNLQNGIVQIYKSGLADLKVEIPAAQVEQLKAGVRGSFAKGMRDLYNAGVQAVKDGLGIESPAKEITNVADEVAAGARESKPEAKIAGEELGATITSSAATQARRKTTDGNLVIDPQTNMYQEQGKMAKLLENRQLGLARASNMQLQAVNQFGARLSGLGIGLSSVTGIASMFGGKIGELAGIVMQVTSLMFALGAATATLTKLKMAEATATAVNSLRRGGGGMVSLDAAGKPMPATITPGLTPAKGAVAAGGGFRGGAKGMAGLGNVIKNVVAMFMNLVGLGKLVTAGFIRMIPVVGWIVTGLTALALIFQKSSEAINGLGDTANLSSKKIESLADIFGVTARTADFASKFTGASAKTSEEKNQVEMVLNSDKFKEDFQVNIDAIKGASEEDAERVLNSLAVQLSSSGFEADAVKAIIDAIVIESGQENLELKFASIDFKSEEGLANMQSLATESAERLNSSFASYDFGDALLGWMGGGQLKTQIQTTAGEFTTLFQALQMGFADGEISSEDFNAQLTNLNNQIKSLDPSAAKELVAALADNLGIKDKVKGLSNFEDQLLLINAAAADIEIPDKVVKLLERASEAGADAKTIQAATKARKEMNELIKEETDLKEELRLEEEKQELMTAAVEEARASLEEQITALEHQSTAYDILTEAGFDAATAIDLVGDAAVAQALALAGSADERQKIINDLITLRNLQNDASARSARATGGGGGGGGSKSDVQQALEDLGKQRTEIKNNIAAYSGLRQAGFSAAEAATVAGDAQLSAALASTKVGSAKWKELVNQIKLVRLEALETSEGLRDAFDGLQSQANEYYDILERQVERKYADGLRAAEKQAKELTRAIDVLNRITEAYQEQVDDIQRSIEIQFDRPIEALNEESSDLANDLTLMDHAADKITKRYDEQAKALAQVAKVNQQIINQQKAQTNLADALASGDIGAAAGLMQDMRAAEADAAAQNQEDSLNAAKESEIASLRSASGMSRVEIEERQFEISQQIYQLEEQREEVLVEVQKLEDAIYDIQENRIEPLENQLQINEDIVQAIEDQKDEEIEAIDAQRRKWEDAELALDLAKVEAGEFNDALDMARQLTGDVVRDWRSLKDQTRRLTIETVTKSVGGAGTAAAIVAEQGSGGGGGGSDDTIPEPKEVQEGSGSETAEGGKDFVAEAFSWLEDQGASVGQWWNGVLLVLAAEWQAVVDGFLTPINNVFVAIGSFIDTLILQPLGKLWDETGGKWLGAIGQGLSDIWAGITSWYDSTVGPWWDSTIGSFLNDVGSWFQGVFDNIGSAVGDAGDWIGQKANDVGAWFGEAGTNVSNWWDGVMGGWNSLQEDPVKWGEDLAKQTQQAFGNAATAVSDWFSQVGSDLSQGGQNLWSRIQNIGPWLAQQWTNISTWFSNLPTNLGIAAGELWGHIQNIGEWLATQWTNFQTWMTTDLPAGILAWGASIWQGMQDVGAWLSTQWTNFMTWMTVTLPAGILAWGASIWQGMQDVGAWLSTQWTNFQTWMTVTLPAGILSWGASIWNGVQNIGAWLTTQWNNFKTWLTVTLPNGVVSWAKNIWTNGMPSLSNWLAAKAEELRLWIVGLPGRIGNWAKNLWDGFWSGFKAGEANTRTTNRAGGGYVSGPGSSTSDSIPANLSDGEFVVQASSVKKFGRGFLNSINRGQLPSAARRPVRVAMPKPSFGKPGMQIPYPMPQVIDEPSFNLRPLPEFTKPGFNLPQKEGSFNLSNEIRKQPRQENSSPNLDNSVYNYSLSVNVEGTNSTPDQIANVVMRKLQGIESQRVRGQVIR
jgi:TP901 family phage tail tape measure protein